jgi:hypothetical protein
MLRITLLAVWVIAKNDKRSDADSKYKPTGKIAAGQAFLLQAVVLREVWQVLRIVCE